MEGTGTGGVTPQHPLPVPYPTFAGPLIWEDGPAWNVRCPSDARNRAGTMGPHRETTSGGRMAMVEQWTGRESRLLRQALRLSVRGFADFLGVGVRTISKWEAAGETRVPRPEFQAMLDTVLARATDEQQARFAELIRPPASAVPEAGPVVSPSRESSRTDAPTATPLPLPHLNVSQLRELGQTLDEAREQTESELAEYFRCTLLASQSRDGDRGPVEALPSALSVVAAIEASARRVSLPVRRELLCLAARGSEFAGWLYRDAGAFDQATYWYDRAAEWAQEAGSAPLQGYVLLRRSQMAYDTRDALRTLTLAQAASTGPWQLPTRVQAEVVQQEALGLAMTGESPTTVIHRLDDARHLLSQANDGEDGTALLGASLTDATLNLRVSVCYTEVGWPTRAAELLSGVLATGSLSRRDAGFFQARQAVALAMSGEPDEAAAVGLVSVVAANATSSQRTRRVLGEVAGKLTPWSSRPAVQSFREAVGY
jgi:DNA-binding transcriptional regulator YiaG